MNRLQSCDLTGKGRLVAAMVALLFTAPLTAQIPLLQRGSHHEKLDFLIGHWHTKTKRLQPVNLEVSAETTFRWKYGGVFLEEYSPTEIEGTGTIHNVMLMTYNKRLQAYEGAMWDNVSPTMVHFQGHWKDERTLELDTGDIELAGRHHRAVVTYTKLSESRLRKELWWSWDNGELDLAVVSELEKTK